MSKVWEEFNIVKECVEEQAQMIMDNALFQSNMVFISGKRAEIEAREMRVFNKIMKKNIKWEK